MSIDLAKNELRKKIKDCRNSIDAQTKAELDLNLAENLFKVKEFVSAETVLCYMSMQNEVDTKEIINCLFKLHKRVALPRCVDLDGKMEFYLISDFSSLEKSRFGVLEPKANENARLTDFNKAVCIMPALAFDIKGNRLGYGKGYYDRFLSTYPICKIGICHDDFVFESIPYQRYDIAADIVVTDKKLIYVKKG